MLCTVFYTGRCTYYSVQTVLEDILCSARAYVCKRVCVRVCVRACVRVRVRVRALGLRGAE